MLNGDDVEVDSFLLLSLRLCRGCKFGFEINALLLECLLPLWFVCSCSCAEMCNAEKYPVFNRRIVINVVVAKVREEANGTFAFLVAVMGLKCFLRFAFSKILGQ